MVASKSLLVTLTAVAATISSVAATPAPKCNVGLNIVGAGAPFNKDMAKCKKSACAAPGTYEKHNMDFMTCIHDFCHSSFGPKQVIKQQKKNPPRQCVLTMNANEVPEGADKAMWASAIQECKAEFCDKRTYVYPNRNFVMCVQEKAKQHGQPQPPVQPPQTQTYTEPAPVEPTQTYTEPAPAEPTPSCDAN